MPHAVYSHGMQHREVEVEAEYLARMETGNDWREEIESLADEEEIDAGWFNAMGAVRDAEVWFYDQREKEYVSVEFDEPLEVAACVGNVSLLDGDHFAHTHAVLSRESGQALAGHLDGGRVFAGEVYMRAFEEPLERSFHDRTQLDLWLNDDTEE
jgi:predicted DNA-binding protein with PD1-like motif